jgi:hypothetical protein
MAVRSQFNNRLAPLARFGFPNDKFSGLPESTGTATALSVAIYTDQQTTLTIQQSPDKVNNYIFEQYTILPNQQYIIQVPVTLAYFSCVLLNETATNQEYCYMVTSLVQQLTQGVDIRPLNSSTDSVSVSNLPAEQLVSGENANFEFYPTAANNNVTVYADGTKGTTVPSGWQYANEITGKINWYCYASPTAETDYKVSQLTSMYTVINQQSTLGLATAQNPWIMIYTRPTGVNDGASWYHNKLFFGSNAHTDISGTKLLYTGTDPVGVHPEITGINRIQLLFVSALSNNKQLADVQNDNIMFGTLQTTNNTSPANSFFFTMNEYGAVWSTVQSVLPIEFGKVQVGGTVGLTPALNTVTITQAVTAVNFTSTAYDLGENSLFDVLMTTTTVGSFAAGSVRLDFSPDGVTWTPHNTVTYSLSSGDPHAVALGIRSGSRYVRVSTGGASAFRSDSFQMTFSSKRD